MDIINEHFKKHPEWPRPAIECADGFHISVQAHYGAYCQPRPMFATSDQAHTRSHGAALRRLEQKSR